jgi:CPA2 family monovalent cation:H+ antiporter-2
LANFRGRPGGCFAPFSHNPDLMPDFAFLQDILILLGAALCNAYLFSRFRQSPIIGYIITGMLVGPYGFHLVKSVHEVEVLAEIGVILLLFTIGLEFPSSRILKLKKPMFIGGTAQVALTALLIFSAARLLGMTSNSALALAFPLALSSTAIVLKLLLERGEMDTAQGRIALAILLFQDLCVVLFLILLPLLAGERRDLSAASLVRTMVLMGGLFLLARFILHPLIRSVLRTRSRELFRLTLLAMVLGTAWVTAEAGLSLALGAFLAGLFLAESEYSHQALADILPFRDTFLAMFFVSIGMLVDIRMLGNHWKSILVFLLVLSLAKACTGAAAAALTACPLRIAFLTGLVLFQAGEFSFVLLRQSHAMGILDSQAYQTALSVVALSMLATPILVPHAPALAGAMAALFGRRPSASEPELLEKTGNLRGHVVIAGYGLSGRSVARVLREMKVPYVIVELNDESVTRGQKAGEFICYGDATSRVVLEEMGIGRARGMVLAINDPPALARAILTARELNPDLYILVRTRFLEELEYLAGLGANEIIPDELEASLQLSACLLRRMGIAEGKILQTMAELRRENYDLIRHTGITPPSTPGALPVLEDGRVEYQAVPENSPCLGKSLTELAFRTETGVIVVGLIRRERTLFGPSPDLRLEPGDTLILLGGPKDVSRAREFLHGHPV